MSWRELQSAFAAAVRDPAQAVPDAVGPRETQPPIARFNVYRNNSAVSLTEAMADSFPVVAELVGEEFFTAMARAYVAGNLPASPVLLHYGGLFPEFIEAFEPAAALPFLADVARVEWAWTQAYHAEDRDSIGAGALQSIDQERLDSARLELHPSVQLPQSDWPAASIWSAHQISGADARQAALQQITNAGECALIVRPEFEVNVQLIEASIFRLLKSLGGGATLGQAAGDLDEDDMQQFGGMLGFIFSTGAVVAVTPGQ